MRWAMIDSNNIVNNIIIWDGQGELFNGRLVIQLEENEPCSIGWAYDKNSSPRFIEQDVPETP